MSSPQFGFGAGAVWDIPSGSNQTPSRLGVLQNIGIDFKAKTVPLFGSNQLPVSQARGSMNVSGTAQLYQMRPRLVSDIVFGSMSTPSSGQIIAQDSEAGSVPGSSTYTITVTNSSGWTTDLGVVYANTGLPLTRVSSAIAVGQYSVSAGVYTFYSGDASAAVKISYLYTTTGGETLTIANKPMGAATTYKTVVSVPFNGNNFGLTLNSCISDSLSMKTALEGYTQFDLAFSAFTDSSDTLGTFSFAEAL